MRNCGALGGSLLITCTSKFWEKIHFFAEERLTEVNNNTNKKKMLKKERVILKEKITNENEKRRDRLLGFIEEKIILV